MAAEASEQGKQAANAELLTKIKRIPAFDQGNNLSYRLDG